MIEKFKTQIRDKGGGASVPVLFPIILLCMSIIYFFALDPIGKNLVSSTVWEVIKSVAFIVILIFASK